MNMADQVEHAAPLSFEWSSNNADEWSSNNAESNHAQQGAQVQGVLEVELIVENDNWLTISKDFEFLKNAAFLALSQPEYQAGQNSASTAIKSPHRLAVILLSDDKSIRELNRTYRNKDNPTNVLSFPSMDEAQFIEEIPESPENNSENEINSEENAGHQLKHVGDAILAYEYVTKEAKTENKPLESHISHLVIHGVLHLLGYDHETTEQAEIMENLEIKLMKQLGLPDPY